MIHKKRLIIRALCGFQQIKETEKTDVGRTPISVSLFIAAWTGLLLLFSCTDFQPEVVIINKTAEHILIRNPSFNGCVWNVMLAYGETTSPGRCLEGTGKVHFQKFDAFEYCREQHEDGTIDSLCSCDTAKPIVDSGLINTTPFWFNYETLSITDAKNGDFVVIELTEDDMDQDFSVPGPYGH
jgi:hypothetical protein